MQELDGRVAAISGAGTGIGVGIARAMAQAGAKLVISAYNSFDGCEALAKELIQDGCEVTAVKIDFRETKAARGLVDTAVEKYGAIDILVNNAGLTFVKPFVECTEADWDEVFNINLKAMFLNCNAAVPHMINQSFGRIINISSVHAIQHVPKYSIYAATKGGINAFTRALSVELAPHGVTANVIGPGAIYVERYDTTGNDVEEMGASIPAGRVGEPADIANAAVYLASSGASYVNGSVLMVDGALTARMSLPARELDS